MLTLSWRKDAFKDIAEGQPCLIRIAGTAGLSCSHGTTVLCHISMPGLKAMGKKLVPDICGAWGCYTCHGIVDGHIKTDLPKETIQLYHLEGMARTVDALVRAGALPNP